jgi:NhaA family Na+:H+ antiporter
MPDEALRTPWSHSDRPVPRRVLRPLQEFLSTATAGGLLLLAAALVALTWANSPFAEGYERLWSTGLSLRLGSWAIREDLRYWVNDGLMALFFLVVGLEIKRELLTGELRHRRAAVLPAVAAVGGMVVPALIYVAITAGSQGVSGWGVAMPTDIAFALGVLTLVASAAPPSLKPFLLTLAIVDDIGTIAVIAVFYSGGVRWVPLLLALAAAGGVIGAQVIHVRASVVYVTLGILLWAAMHRSGVHPAMAGVVMGLLTPAVAFQRPRSVSKEAHRTADETLDDPYPPDADAPQWLRLATLSREAVSPLARVEHSLLPWVTFAVLPLFALANAGVALSGEAFADAVGSRVAIGIVVARVAGKVGGITLACWLVVRAGIAPLPAGATWAHIAGVGATASIAFTVSLFVADLALPAELQDAAKVGILASALAGGALAYAIFRWSRPQSS